MILIETDFSMTEAYLKCKWLNFFYLVVVQGDLSQMFHSFKSLKNENFRREVVRECARLALWLCCGSNLE